jgi:hypothetical protein
VQKCKSEEMSVSRSLFQKIANFTTLSAIVLSKWWFSATDIVRAINDEDDYKKCRNYWKYLKGKMVKEGIQLVRVFPSVRIVERSSIT